MNAGAFRRRGFYVRRMGRLCGHRLQDATLLDARTMKYGVDVSGCFMAGAGVMPLALVAYEILVSDKL